MSGIIATLLSSEATGDPVERLLLCGTVDHGTRTEEYVRRHDAMLRLEAGMDPTDTPIERRAAAGFLDRRRSESAVKAALDRLVDRGLIERADPPTDRAQSDGVWWVLTERGLDERNRLVEQFEERLRDLRLEFGIVEEA